MFSLDDKNVLSKIKIYRLDQEEGYCYIYVVEGIAGAVANKFIATPVLPKNIKLKKEYVGKGNTEEEAVNNCLKEIKDITIKGYPPDLFIGDPHDP